MERFEADQSGQTPAPRARRVNNYESVTELVAERVRKSHGKITAKRLLPIVRAAGYTGSDRNFRRLVSRSKSQWRRNQFSGRRPGGVGAG